MRSWRAVKLWEGATVYILGGGPSLSQVDTSVLRDKRVIGVNDAFRFGPDIVDICWFGDCRWHKWNEDDLRAFSGLVISCSRCKCDLPWILQLRRADCAGLSMDPSLVYWNKSSGASAINLAALLGATRIVLLGFDMKMEGGKHNWHSFHKHAPRNTIYQNLFLPPFDQIAKDAEKYGIEILNATTGSALDVFPKVVFNDVV